MSDVVDTALQPAPAPTPTVEPCVSNFDDGVVADVE